MKSSLIAVVAFASVMGLSAAALAESESCASKKGAHKDMSASVSKDGMNHHSGIVSQNTVKTEPSAALGTEVKQEVPLQSTQGALKI